MEIAPARAFWCKSNECVNTVQRTFNGVISSFYTYGDFHPRPDFKPPAKQMLSYVFIPSGCKHFFKNLEYIMFTSSSVNASAALDLFCLPFLSSLLRVSRHFLFWQKYLSLIMLTAYLPFLKLFLPLPSV